MGRSRCTARKIRISSMSNGRPRRHSAMATAHSSTGIRSLRSGAISLARAGAISAIGVVQITSTEEATRTSPSAVARRKTMSPAHPATVEFIAAPIAMSPQNHHGGRGIAPSGMPAISAVITTTAATRPRAGQLGNTQVRMPSASTTISLVPAHSRCTSESPGTRRNGTVRIVIVGYLPGRGPLFALVRSARVRVAANLPPARRDGCTRARVRRSRAR